MDVDFLREVFFWAGVYFCFLSLLFSVLVRKNDAVPVVLVSLDSRRYLNLSAECIGGAVAL